jgi:hypothetical protein
MINSMKGSKLDIKGMDTGKKRIANSEIVTVMRIILCEDALGHFLINKIKKSIT